MTRWGVVTTTRAPLGACLDFAAWHLSLGAQRIYLYLDEDAPEVMAALKAHPKVRVIRTDGPYWAKQGGRPDKHQVRQGLNARHAHARRIEVDWIAHIDIDEFLLPETPMQAQLAALAPDALCARVRPIEALAPDPAQPRTPGEVAFKAFHLDQHARQAAAERCFPGWAHALPGGFLSHVAGKLFLRTGLEAPEIRIHNVFVDGVQNPGEVELDRTALGHFHAASVEAFLASYRFRIERGSYRADLKPQVRQAGAPTLHALLTGIEAEGGEAALRRFHAEVATATPELCTRLAAEGLLRRHVLDLPALRARHFPDAAAV